MKGMPITVMFVAAALKCDIIRRGISIPNFLKEYPEVNKMPKEHLDYVKGQGKKLLLAMKGRDNAKQRNGEVK